MQTVSLLCQLAYAAWRAKLQHRSAFWMMMVGYGLSTVIELLSIGVLFARFHQVRGWKFPEVAMLYAVMGLGFSTAEGLARGFDTFSIQIRYGGFDRMLLRPLHTLAQVAVSDVQPMRLGRWIQSLAVLLWSMYTLQISFFSWASLLLLCVYIGLSCVFCGLLVLQATCSFWVTEALEIFNIATFGGREAAQFPLSIYDRPLRFLFMFVIPLGCVGYLPVATILHKESIPYWLGTAAPLLGPLFLLLCCCVWQVGVRHYRSTGS